MSTQKPITLLINSNSRKGRLNFRAAIQALKNSEIPLGETYAVRSQAETKHILQREIERGAKTVIVGGGDGTLSECAGLLAHTETAMGILPLGTGNTFVRSVGIPLDLDGAAQNIARGQIQAVDLGCVNKQVFLNSVSLGLSVEIAGALDKRIKRRLGVFAWPIIGARIVATHRPLYVQVTSDEHTFKVRTHQLVVVNGRYVAGPVPAAPDASVQDSHFDVFVLGGAHKGTLLRATWNWLRGRHVYTAESRYFMTKSLRVESTRHVLQANVDGDINDATPLELRVLPAALRVIVPQNFEAKNV